MRLPSGRSITLPYPEKKPITMVKVVTDGKSEWQRVSGHFDDPEDTVFGSRAESCFKTWELSYYGHTEGANYGRVPTYGGDLLQGATQGVGADLLAHGVIEAERAGFDPFLLVHDQCLTPAGPPAVLFERALCKVPEWFAGFPLEADANEVRSYCKI
jgi:hypothetical protein